MHKLLQILVILFAASLSISCAGISKSTKSFFKNSTLSNLNPAPKKLSPPDKMVGQDELVDPVYLQTQADYHYTLGEALSLEGQNQKAIEEFKLTLVYDPQSVEVRVRLSAEYIKSGMLSEALEQAEAAVDLDPSSHDGRLLLGGLYSSLRMYDLAMKQYEFLHIEYPDDLDVPVYMGALLAEQEKFKESVRVFKSLASHPKNENPFKAYYYIGRIFSDQINEKNITQHNKLFKQSEKAFLKSLGLQPDEEDTVIALSRLYVKLDREKKSLSILKSFQDKFGPKKEVASILSLKYLEQENYDEAYEQLENLEGFDPDDLNIKVKMSLILIEQKKYDPAIKKLEEIIRLSPESDKIRFYLGAVYEEVKKPKSAIFHFSQIHSASMYYPEAVIHSAYMYKTLGDYDSSIDVVKKGIKEKDDLPQFYAFYASLLDDLKKYREAVVMLKSATKKFPVHTQLLFFLGSMQDRLGNTNETISSMKRVIEIDQEHVQALNYLAYTYADRGVNLDEAETMALKALGLKPEDSYILDTVGWVIFKRGRVEEALKYLEAAYNNNKTESIIAEHLGDVYYRMELLDKALGMYEAAAENSDDEERVRDIKTKMTLLTKQKNRLPASK